VARIRAFCPPRPAAPDRLDTLVGGLDSQLLGERIAARIEQPSEPANDEPHDQPGEEEPDA
jgi:hypothetical protein